MNTIIRKNKWPTIQSEIQKTWSNLSQESLSRTNGDTAEVATLVQNTYGITREVVLTKINEIIQRLKAEEDLDINNDDDLDIDLGGPEAPLIIKERDFYTRDGGDISNFHH